MGFKNRLNRVSRFFLVIGIAFVLIYGILPWLTGRVDILNRMSLYLADNGINPTNYYYTDVEQVAEAEQYLRTVLGD